VASGGLFIPFSHMTITGGSFFSLAGFSVAFGHAPIFCLCNGSPPLRFPLVPPTPLLFAQALFVVQETFDSTTCSPVKLTLLLSHFRQSFPFSSLSPMTFGIRRL